MPKKCQGHLLVKAGLLLPAVTIMVVLLVPAGPAAPTLAQNCTTAPQTGISLYGNSFLSSTGTGNNFNLSNVSINGVGSQPLICGSGATIPQYTLPAYTDMKSYYYDKKPAAEKYDALSATTLNAIGSMASPNFSTSGNYLYHIPGDFTVDTDPDISGTPGVKVFFVDGNLFFNSPLTFAHQSGYSGYIFIVQGNIWVNYNVCSPNNRTEIGAMIIDYGSFCDTWDGNFPPSCPGATTCPLAINGSLVYAGSSGQPNFNRNLSLSYGSNGNPAEQINYQPKYLIIARDIFASTLTVWTQIQ